MRLCWYEPMYLCLIVSHLRTDVMLVTLIEEGKRELDNASSFDLSEYRQHGKCKVLVKDGATVCKSTAFVKLS